MCSAWGKRHRCLSALSLSRFRLLHRERDSGKGWGTGWGNIFYAREDVWWEIHLNPRRLRRLMKVLRAMPSAGRPRPCCRRPRRGPDQHFPFRSSLSFLDRRYQTGRRDDARRRRRPMSSRIFSSSELSSSSNVAPIRHSTGIQSGVNGKESACSSAGSSSTVTIGFSATTTACSMAFSSWRTLPGQA